MNQLSNLGRDARSHDVWMKALLAGGILFVAWRLLRGIRSMFWSAFGIAMAVHYSGMTDWWS